MHKNVKRVLLVSVMMLLLLLGTQTALAQSPEEEGAWGGRLFGRLRARFAGTIDAIAEALGLSAEELTEQLGADASLADLAEERDIPLADLRDASEAARAQARREQIEQAVAEGDMTQEEADWILEGLDNGYSLGLKGRGPAMRGNSEAVQEAVADALGLSADELELQLWAGEALADLAQDAGVDLDTVLEAQKAAREEAMRERINDAEANGTIGTDEADWMLEGLEQGYLGNDHAFEKGGFMDGHVIPGRGPGGRMPRARGDGQGAPPEIPDTQE